MVRSEKSGLFKMCTSVGIMLLLTSSLSGERRHGSRLQCWMTTVLQHNILVGARYLISKAFNQKDCIARHVCKTGYKWRVTNESRCSLFLLWLSSMLFKRPAQAHYQITWQLASTIVTLHMSHESSSLLRCQATYRFTVYLLMLQSYSQKVQLKPRSPLQDDKVLIRETVPLVWCSAPAVVTIFY